MKRQPHACPVKPPEEEPDAEGLAMLLLGLAALIVLFIFLVVVVPLL
jgi:hypothetical protein